MKLDGLETVKRERRKSFKRTWSYSRPEREWDNKERHLSAGLQITGGRLHRLEHP